MAVAPPAANPLPTQALAAPTPVQRQPRSQRESATQTARATKSADRAPKSRERDRRQERGALVNLST